VVGLSGPAKSKESWWKRLNSESHGRVMERPTVRVRFGARMRSIQTMDAG